MAIVTQKPGSKEFIDEIRSRLTSEGLEALNSGSLPREGLSFSLTGDYNAEADLVMVGLMYVKGYLS